MEITDVREIHGQLITSLGRFWMLEEFPRSNAIPFYLRQEGMVSFLVENDAGYAVTIFVRSDNYIIERFPKKVEHVVKFVVDDEKE